MWNLETNGVIKDSLHLFTGVVRLVCFAHQNQVAGPSNNQTDMMSRSLLMWEKNSYAHDGDEDVVVAKYMLAFLGILLAVVYSQYFIGKVWKFHYFPESGVAIAIGMFVSAVIRLTELYSPTLDHEHKSVTEFVSFSTTLFFIGLLPPIIFNSGYQIKHHLFFANMGGITSLAFYGTGFSALFVGLFLWIAGQINITIQITFMEALCFGSLISATDPVSTLAVFSELKVDPHLFYLVFGESVLNDAIGISLFNTTKEFVGKEMTVEAIVAAIAIFMMTFTLSCLIGYVSGVLSAGLFKAVDLSHHPIILMTVFFTIVYIPFLISEVLQLSGIVTILFSAITLKRYCVHSIPSDVRPAPP
jgi:NhaP-type Na+/H+ or K+/H+ antiporter